MKEKYYEYKNKILNAKTKKELREIKVEFSLDDLITVNDFDKLIKLYIVCLAEIGEKVSA